MCIICFSNISGSGFNYNIFLLWLWRWVILDIAKSLTSKVGPLRFHFWRWKVWLQRYVVTLTSIFLLGLLCPECSLICYSTDLKPSKRQHHLNFSLTFVLCLQAHYPASGFAFFFLFLKSFLWGNDLTMVDFNFHSLQKYVWPFISGRDKVPVWPLQWFREPRIYIFWCKFAFYSTSVTMLWWSL